MTESSTDETICPHASSCEMYSLFKSAGTLQVFQSRYCRGAYETCARYELARSGKNVPLQLMPNGQTLKRAIK